MYIRICIPSINICMFSSGTVTESLAPKLLSHTESLIIISVFLCTFELTALLANGWFHFTWRHTYKRIRIFHGCMHTLYVRVSSRVQSQRISLYDFVINNVSLSNDFDDDFEGENFDSIVSMTSIIKAKSTTHCMTLQHTATHCSTL